MFYGVCWFVLDKRSWFITEYISDIVPPVEVGTYLTKVVCVPTNKTQLQACTPATVQLGG